MRITGKAHLWLRCSELLLRRENLGGWAESDISWSERSGVLTGTSTSGEVVTVRMEVSLVEDMVATGTVFTKKTSTFSQTYWLGQCGEDLMGFSGAEVRRREHLAFAVSQLLSDKLWVDNRNIGWFLVGLEYKPLAEGLLEYILDTFGVRYEPVQEGQQVVLKPFSASDWQKSCVVRSMSPDAAEFLRGYLLH